MGNLSEIGVFKRAIVDAILEDKLSVDLIKPDKPEDFESEDLFMENVFDYGKVPDINEKAETFVTVDAGVPEVLNNKLLKDVEFRITIISHDGVMRVPGSVLTRVDYLASRIDELLNGSREFGGVSEVELISSMPGVLDTGQPFKVNIYRVVEVNGNHCGVDL